MSQKFCNIRKSCCPFKISSMQNAGLKHINFDGNYDKHHLEDGSTIKMFLASNYKGANITVPHKEFAHANADEIRGIAQKNRSCKYIHK